ncbi:MAG TPA: shikimate dehydrogenase [Gemmataceae bacterium]|jgi:shikimate dehydrogenase|nr:shikimate dehydrogenase [Gemmataceae bacterium]
MPQQNFLPDLAGSMSQGAAGNPTVAMIEAGFAHHGLAWRYINLEVTPENLGAAVRGAVAMGFRGFNCSLPHKVAVIRHLDSLGESAAVMGAVNCVVVRDRKTIGENTDGKGFLKSLQQVTDPSGKSVVLFGAGGAARAIAVELGLAGIKAIAIVNRSPARGSELAELLRTKLNLDATFVPWSGAFRIPPGTDVVINATSIGLYDAEARLDLDVDTLKPGMVVADVIGNPPRTRLIRDAEARGCATVDGLGMLVNQGIIAARYWTGVDLDAAVLRRALEKALDL